MTTCIAMNSTDCNSYINSTSQLVVNLSVYGAITSIGAISSLAAVVIILAAKGYNEFVYMEIKQRFSSTVITQSVSLKI